MRTTYARTRLALASAAACAGLALAGVAPAADRSWSPTAPDNASFQDATQWSGGQVPGPADHALFTLTGPGKTVRFDASATNDRLSFTSGTAAFDLVPKDATYSLTSTTSPSILIGAASGDVAHLSILRGTLAGTTAVLGDAAGATGTLTLDAATHGKLSLTDSLTVGRAGSGALRVGGSVQAGSFYIAREAGSTGALTFLADGGFLGVTGDLHVGGDASGAGGTGTLDVTGSGSRVAIGGTLTVHTGSTARIDASEFTVGGIANGGGAIDWQRGVFWVTSAGLDIGTGGAFTDVRLTADRHLIASAGTTIKSGGKLVVDGGTLEASNLTGPALAVQPGGQLRFNSGGIRLDGAAAHLIATYTGTLLGTFDHVTPGYTVEYLPGEIYATAVPEPTTLATLTLAVTALTKRRRRTNQTDLI